MKKIWIIALALLVFAACKKNTDVNLKDLDLLPYGIPLTVKAPETAKITANDMAGLLTEVMIEDTASFYNMQVSASKALVNDVAELKSEALENAKNGPFFSKLILEEKDGFIFETNIDSVITYNFNYLMVQGDKQYKFEKIFTSLSNQEEAEKMYKIAKMSK